MITKAYLRHLFTEIKCKLLGHPWSMYAGYDQIRAHSTAHCLRNPQHKPVKGKDY